MDRAAPAAVWPGLVSVHIRPRLSARAARLCAAVRTHSDDSALRAGSLGHGFQFRILPRHRGVTAAGLPALQPGPSRVGDLAAAPEPDSPRRAGTGLRLAQLWMGRRL